MTHLDGVDVIYWINMERSTDRRTYMENLLADPAFDGIPKQRIPAIDGRTQNVIQHFVMKRQERCSDIEYACFLSHLETIRKFAEEETKGSTTGHIEPSSSRDVALIMEDDVSLDFRKYWTKSIREIIDSAPNDWDIILLSYMTSPEKIPQQDFVLAYGHYFSAAAYLINRKSAQKFMRDTYRGGKYHLDDSARHVADEYPFHKMRAYVYKHPYFIYKANNDTTLLHQGSLNFHESSRKHIEDVLYGSNCWLRWIFIFIMIVLIVIAVLRLKIIPKRFLITTKMN